MFGRHMSWVKRWMIHPGRLLGVLVGAGFGLMAWAGDDGVRFNRDIRPVLSDNCFACHGPDARAVKGGLRLDLRDSATSDTRSGVRAIVPGDPEGSELIRRLYAADEDELMPPPEAHKTLTEGQKELFKKWIAAGAEYEGHWAYQAPEKPLVPEGARAVDHLVRPRLGALGLEPAPEADKRTLVRRLYWDLIGLPASAEDVARFEKDTDPAAWGRLVETLLASPRHGERMAMEWLDVVRYADTIGYHSDTPRNVWPYRDYVIRAFNENKPFDQFTIEQLAGDLLPEGTREQLVGSAFNRLLLTTEEGGAQPKDYEARYLTDRVRAVGTVWMGQTLGCAQCHDHKFDPIATKDFYAMGAFFADIDEALIGRREDGMLLPDEAQEIELGRLRERVTAYEGAMASVSGLEGVFELWLRDQKARIEGGSEVKEGKPAPPDKKLVALLEVEEGERSDAQKGELFAIFKNTAPELAGIREGLAAAKKAFSAYEATVARCLVTRRNETPRTVRILPRGDWMDESGEVVDPALPGYLASDLAGDESGRKLNRLDLAKWLVSRENPLTARVVMNRLWRQLFGTGLSKVLDDLGSQGEPPTHPELLDWLACEFMDSGWDMKHMVRTLVQSATYRQSSISTLEQRARDPENRELARQSRWRLDAEWVRDQALNSAGLLVERIGGPSVMPYQPAGYWENLNFPVRDYMASSGGDQYRRGLYTWWQRSFVHPSMLAFDAPTREECAVERSRSNIPQQALVLLNDPTYVEAARHLAARILSECGGTIEERIRWAWQLVLARDAGDDEVAMVRSLIDKHLSELGEAPNEVEALLSVGQKTSEDQKEPVDRIEWAAWTSAARTLLNLHETITRP